MLSPELNTETRDFNQQPSQFSFSQVSEDSKCRVISNIIVTLLARWILSFYTSGQDKADASSGIGMAQQGAEERKQVLEKKDQFGQCLFASEYLEAEQH